MKYLKNGQAVEVVVELPKNGGFVVETYDEDSQTGEVYLSGSTKIVKQVFDAPPVDHIAEEYASLQKKLADIRKEIATAEKTARESAPEWIVMFNKKSLSEVYRAHEGRVAGSGGGGQSLQGGMTPHFCKTCGKTVPRNKVKPSVDVCSKCRARK